MRYFYRKHFLENYSFSRKNYCWNKQNVKVYVKIHILGKKKSIGKVKKKKKKEYSIKKKKKGIYEVFINIKKWKINY